MNNLKEQVRDMIREHTKRLENYRAKYYSEKIKEESINIATEEIMKSFEGAL